MRIREALAQTRSLTGITAETVTDPQLVRWLSELDGQLALVCFHAEIWQPYDAESEEELQSELLVPYPWDGEIYVHYLEAKLYFSTGESARYANAAAVYENALARFRAFVARTAQLPKPAERLPFSAGPRSTGTATVVSNPERRVLWSFLSAYGTAVKHGYRGTEEEWLESLMGPQGPKGDPGEPGAKGDKGDTGEAGATGPKGDKGDKGDTGEPGATGPKGDKGDKGDTGETGAQGATGPQGPQGVQGPKGDKGDTGETGATGAKGEDGADGVSPAITVTDIPGGHRVTVTDREHPTGQSFDVLNGSGSGDMTAAVYDPAGGVAQAGGIPSFVTSAVAAHIADKANPHEVTAAQVGLGNVDNTSDADKPISTAQAAVNAGNQAQLDAFLTPKTIGPTALASFSDGVDGAILGKCVVNVEPAQSGSGDPSPTNVRPISGWTGATVSVMGSNLLALSVDALKEINTSGYWTGNAYTLNGITFTLELDASGNIADIHVSGVLESGVSALNIARNVTIKPGRYCLQIQKTANPQAFVQFIQNGKYLPYYSSSLLTYRQEHSQKVSIRLVVDNPGAFDTKISFMMKEGADATSDYEPYKGNQYDISFGEAGTVYGGTLDVGTGVLTVDRIIVSARWGDWTNTSNVLENVDGKYFTSTHAIKSGWDGQLLSKCNVSNYYLWDVNFDDVHYYLDNNKAYVFLPKDFNENENVQVICPLVTPITYQLTPVRVRTLLGLNNIYADCGDVTVQYRGDVPNLYENVAVITEQKNKFYCPPLYQYDGEDLTVKFASEIAQYSDVCAWLKARLEAKNISGIFVKDFFKFTTSNNVTFTARVADVNHDLGYGNTEVTKYHIDFICDELWPDNHVWNKVNYNNGLAAEPSPWLCSDLYHFLNSLSGNVPNGTGADPETVAVDYTSTGVLDKFPAWLRNAIVERRSMEPTRYSAGALLTDDNSYEWKNIGKLWVPSEIEYYGFIAWGTRNGYSIGESHMYQLMLDGKMRIKRKPDGSRCSIWLRRAYSGNSTYAAYCGSGGDVYRDNCVSPWPAPPVCFRIMAN